MCVIRYRRSYDSEFTAPLVAYHVWPALMEEDSVIVKGEAVTRRGALVRALLEILRFEHIWLYPKQKCSFVAIAAPMALMVMGCLHGTLYHLPYLPGYTPLLGLLVLRTRSSICTNGEG